MDSSTTTEAPAESAAAAARDGAYHPTRCFVRARSSSLTTSKLLVGLQLADAQRVFDCFTFHNSGYNHNNKRRSAATIIMSNDTNNPWGWLGLLKWSLAYSDGTKDSEHKQMSAEDKAFLEAVMKDGIIDENERMKEILKQVTTQMERWKSDRATAEDESQVEELLDELRFIVEQIDYARAFAAMKGLPFLLGCIQETDAIPISTRSMCLGLLCTLCQHNPPLQTELLELGSLKVLSVLFFSSLEGTGNNDHHHEPQKDSNYQARIMQVISANVRSHEMAETVFCQLEQAPQLLLDGVAKDAPISLRKRALFFLRALVTSDTSSTERVRLFDSSIVTVIDSVLLDADAATTITTTVDGELLEMSLALITQLLAQGKGVDGILTRRDALATASIARVAALRERTGADEQDDTAIELGLWEELLTRLARAVPDLIRPTTTTTTTTTTTSDAPPSVLALPVQREQS